MYSEDKLDSPNKRANTCFICEYGPKSVQHEIETTNFLAILKS